MPTSRGGNTIALNPVARVRTFLLDSMPLSLYWGNLIPLWYLGATFSPPPKVVVAGASIEVFGPAHVGPGGYIAPGVTREEYVGFGRAVRAAVAETGRRIAVIASVDLAHRHTADGPFGFDPAAAPSDAEVVELVRANALDHLFRYDADTVDHAVTEVVEPCLALHGLIEGENLRAEVLSYEVPNYFGMMCAAYGR